jgi:hypothetical protein
VSDLSLIEILLFLILVGIGDAVYRLRKVIEIGAQIVHELKASRPSIVPGVEEPLPPPLELDESDVRHQEI